jgi:hypothetical protein
MSTHAPFRSRIDRMVGRAATIRLSSVILPGGQCRLRNRRCEGCVAERDAEADDIDDGVPGRYRRFA